MFEFVLVGFAGFFIWYVLAQATILDKPLGWVREHWAPLVGCGMCAGFWITGLLILTADGVSGYDLFTHLAAASVVGVLGSFQ